MYYEKSKPTIMCMTTQSSISSTGSAKSQTKRSSQNTTQKEDTVSASPPCAQPCFPNADANGSNDTSSQESRPETIEVSEGERKSKSTDNEMVEGVEADDDELGGCEIECGRSVN